MVGTSTLLMEYLSLLIFDHMGLKRNSRAGNNAPIIELLIYFQGGESSWK